MSMMIWVIAGMYLFRMVIRDLVTPYTYSEYCTGQLELEAINFKENMVLFDTAFTALTALMFLSMYYIFASASNGSIRPKAEKKQKKTSSASDAEVLDLDDMRTRNSSYKQSVYR